VTGRVRDRAVLALVTVGHLLVLYWPRAAETGDVPHLDKLVHALVFGGVLWAGRRAGLPDRVLVPALAVHAVVSEALQAWLLPGRSGDPADVGADLAGVLLVIVAGGRPGRRGPAWDWASWRNERAGSGGSGGGR
jgi:hypothetical protein